MKVGFIGGGNMGSAMIENLAQRLGGERVFVYARSKTAALREKCGVNACESEAAVASAADITVLATKPAAYEGILNLIKEVARGKVIVTLAPSFSLEQSMQILGAQAKIARAMPNTPAAIAEGVSALCFNENLSADERTAVREIFENFGAVYELEEAKFAAFTGIAGSLPAYVFMFIEAAADAGVLEGLPRALAHEAVAASVAGSARLMLKSGKHPAVLKDEICSPGGTTIEAVKALENGGFRAAAMDAVAACVKKARG
ncbi:pyrroline-5-carboxylate reductase [uncultured Campylobacter sp.]|uniref:pyrroline-5-carboxylate reductase n=1 Tax=uncultured Campylobacter sp. TaxID=218934 RepID=UPI0026331578|nr:pyrroline-5-carboxylate reductase [uncultured Campylobacter sp.]